MYLYMLKLILLNILILMVLGREREDMVEGQILQIILESIGKTIQRNLVGVGRKILNQESLHIKKGLHGCRLLKDWGRCFALFVSICHRQSLR